MPANPALDHAEGDLAQNLERFVQRYERRNTEEPMTDDELAAASEVIEKLRVEVRADLADDLGGHPSDYHADRYFTSLEESNSETEETVPDGRR